MLAWRHFSFTLAKNFRSFVWSDFDHKWLTSLKKVTLRLLSFEFSWNSLRSKELKCVVKVPNEKASVEWILKLYHFLLNRFLAVSITFSTCICICFYLFLYGTQVFFVGSYSANLPAMFNISWIKFIFNFCLIFLPLFGGLIYQKL